MTVKLVADATPSRRATRPLAAPTVNTISAATSPARRTEPLWSFTPSSLRRALVGSPRQPPARAGASWPSRKRRQRSPKPWLTALTSPAAAIGEAPSRLEHVLGRHRRFRRDALGDHGASVSAQG